MDTTRYCVKCLLGEDFTFYFICSSIVTYNECTLQSELYNECILQMETHTYTHTKILN